MGAEMGSHRGSFVQQEESFLRSMFLNPLNTSEVRQKEKIRGCKSSLQFLANDTSTIWRYDIVMAQVKVYYRASAGNWQFGELLEFSFATSGYK
jgi:hypothetical protein